jgi:hypothetical protein
MNQNKLAKRPSASNHTIQKNLLKQEMALKEEAVEASEQLLRKPGMSEHSAGIRMSKEERVEGHACPGNEPEASNQGCFNESLGAFATRQSLLQVSSDYLGTGTSLVNLQATNSKYTAHHNFDLFDGEEELSELLEKQELLFSEGRQSEDHINSSLSEESLIMEFEAQATENVNDGPKESSLEGMPLPKADSPCSPYGKMKPFDRNGVVDLDHYIIQKEEVILADLSDQQSESGISREESLSEFGPYLRFNFGEGQARSMRSMKIEQDIFGRIRPDPHQHFLKSEFRFKSPLQASHLPNTMKTSSFDCIIRCRVVRRTKSVAGKVNTENIFFNRF